MNAENIFNKVFEETVSKYAHSLVFQETERMFKPYLEERLKQELELIIKSPEIQEKLKEAVLSFVRYQKNSKP